MRIVRAALAALVAVLLAVVVVAAPADAAVGHTVTVNADGSRTLAVTGAQCTQAGGTRAVWSRWPSGDPLSETRGPTFTVSGTTAFSQSLVISVDGTWDVGIVCQHFDATFGWLDVSSTTLGTVYGITVDLFPVPDTGVLTVHEMVSTPGSTQARLHVTGTCPSKSDLLTVRSGSTPIAGTQSVSAGPFDEIFDQLPDVGTYDVVVTCDHWDSTTSVARRTRTFNAVSITVPAWRTVGATVSTSPSGSLTWGSTIDVTISGFDIGEYGAIMLCDPGTIGTRRPPNAGPTTSATFVPSGCGGWSSTELDGLPLDGTANFARPTANGTHSFTLSSSEPTSSHCSTGSCDLVVWPDGCVRLGGCVVAGKPITVVAPAVTPPIVAPSPPSTLGVTGTTVTVKSAAIATDAAADSAGVPSGYRIFVYEGSSSTPLAQLDTDVSTRTATFTGLSPGHRYRFKAAGINAGGEGPRSGFGSFTLLPFATFDAFTNRQYLDFAGRNATTAEKGDWSTKLGNGTLTPVAAIDTAQAFAYWQKQSPIVRLFRAYFLRLPDYTGLNYWTNKSRGGLSLSRISSSFAGSSEFKNRYGSLSNQAFVELVYQNVLGRPGEPSGVTYWTTRLDNGSKTRGAVMVGFSESSEYRTKTTALVDTVNVYTGMLRRIPTTGEVTTWAPADSPPPRTDLIAALLASAEYDART